MSPCAVPETFNIVTYLLDRHIAAGLGARPAIHYGGGTVTYSGLLDLAGRAANVLADCGLQREQRCLIVLPDGPELIAVFLAAMRLGAVPVPVSPLAEATEYQRYLNDSRARVVVLCPDAWPRLERACVASPYLRRMLATGSEAVAGCDPLERLLSEASPECPVAPTSRDDVSHWLYTSEATGQPAAVMHLHHDMVCCVEPYAAEVLNATPDDVFLSELKLWTYYGLANSLYLPLALGASVLLNRDESTSSRLLTLIRQEEPTLFFADPVVYAAVLGEDERHELGRLRLCLTSTGALPAPLYERWRARYSVELLPGIGSAEFGYIYISSRPGQVEPGSCGTVIPPYEARVRGHDGEAVSVGSVGQLHVRSESVAAGYWGKHEQTKRTFVGDWLRTGNFVRTDEDGHYFLVETLT